MKRHCQALNQRGEPCRQNPSTDGDLCFWHDPAFAEDAARARQAGGANHRREQTLQAVYDIWGVDSLEDAQQVTKVATLGLLALENSVARNRALLGAAMTIAKLIETGQLAQDLAEIKKVVQPRIEAERQRGSKRRWRPW